jgi:uncharacterized membrane protein
MIVSIGSLVRGALYGAGAMYFFDPDRGRRRRAGVSNQAIRLGHEAEDFWHKGCRDLTNRGRGFAADVRRFLTSEAVDDNVVTARVRAVLGHCVHDARSVDVQTLNGTVTLRGTVRPGEPERLIPIIESIGGVRDVQSGLSIAGAPVGCAATQQLSPGTRLLITAGGGLLLLNGLARRGFGPTLLGTVGLGLFVRGLTDKPGRLIGVGDDRAIEFRKSIRIDAPVEKVFEFVSDVEQSGRFLPEAVDVESLGDGRVRWTVHGPGGIGRMTCDEQVLESIENQRIVWASTPDAPIRYFGEARFCSEGDSTRLDVRLSYEPPGGMLAHTAASLLGLDPKTQLDRSLNRIKRYLEEGTVPRGVSERAVKEHRG